ncbi:uncharacterized protein LOC131183175 [Hevea brasiliensis]|uniref:uncharacterized protein LOC131183175 n=1 Tax=Hevea brasiliensis TaxID=3981 RepID=UPI0025CCCE8B|nr:uncharacterized protein LOC131183175 [Hevea brasiliensis]
MDPTSQRVVEEEVQSHAPPMADAGGRGEPAPLAAEAPRPEIESIEKPEARAPTRAYAMRAPMEQDAPDIIRGMFSLYDIPLHVLVDPGSTHLYICIELPMKRGIQVEESDQDILVTNPLEHSVVVNRVCKGFPFRIQGYKFSADLIELPFHEFDLILGIDWLSRHQAIVDCRLKRITLKTPENDEITVIGERADFFV